ncbi:hypothetical protein CDL15_Pgr019529 [Punica granatum]|uniref:Uncharacterized protein n=1 Tax=Punica granatum TaxID=22663 RepID=A0A218X6A7_PUNGR|nr:hypothetical protein CDL15_Pgr019529 [Punica granatum]
MAIILVIAVSSARHWTRKKSTNAGQSWINSFDSHQPRLSLALAFQNGALHHHFDPTFEHFSNFHLDIRDIDNDFSYCSGALAVVQVMPVSEISLKTQRHAPQLVESMVWLSVHPQFRYFHETKFLMVPSLLRPAIEENGC